MVMHCPIVGKVKNVTVSVVAGDWFVSIKVEHDVAVVPVDLGGVQPIVLSDATVDQSARTKGSRNRAKAQRRVARLQAGYARRRKDAVHKATTMIAKSHGVIVIEDLKVKAMTKSGRGTKEDPVSSSRSRRTKTARCSTSRRE